MRLTNSYTRDATTDATANSDLSAALMRESSSFVKVEVELGQDKI